MDRTTVIYSVVFSACIFPGLDIIFNSKKLNDRLLTELESVTDKKSVVIRLLSKKYDSSMDNWTETEGIIWNWLSSSTSFQSIQCCSNRWIEMNLEMIRLNWIDPRSFQKNLSRFYLEKLQYFAERKLILQIRWPTVLIMRWQWCYLHFPKHQSYVKEQ